MKRANQRLSGRPHIPAVIIGSILKPIQPSGKCAKADTNATANELSTKISVVDYFVD
jgi:hypothetical protein